MHRLFFDEILVAGLEHFGIPRLDQIGLVLCKQLMGALADHFAARKSAELLGRPIDQYVTMVSGILDDECHRNVFDDCIEKRFSTVAVSLPPAAVQ